MPHRPGRPEAHAARSVVWLNGTHGVGKTTTAALLPALLPGSRVLDAEKVGETLMDVRPALPELGDFQHWPPWRPLVVETVRHVLDYVGGPLVVPMTVLVEAYWRELGTGLAAHGVVVHHLVLDADETTLRARIDGDLALGPSRFRHSRLAAYAQARRTWLPGAARLLDTTGRTPEQVARLVQRAVTTASAADGASPG